MSKEAIPAWAAEATAAILQAVLKKDPFTFYHCCRVGQAARRLGEVMGMPEFDLAILEYSGLFHDVGKVGLPDSVLLKPGRLDNKEHTQMKDHAEMSVDILRPLTKHAFFRYLVPGVRYHHERFDGKGYPIGLMGEKIPVTARMIAVVDAVDAMMNTRPYREAMTWDYVQSELIKHSGSQFDPRLAQIYLEAANKGLFEQPASEREVIVPAILRAA